ncbi:MAG: hypothetical protein AAFN93_26320 [Bacteroidota bacterium]
MRKKKLCTLFAFLFYTTIFGQLSDVQVITDEIQTKVVLSSNEFGEIEFKCQNLSVQLEIVDFFIDGQFGVVVTKNLDGIYHFSSAFRNENEWQIDHCGASILRGEGSELAGYKTVVKEIEIINGETLKIEYSRLNYSRAAAARSNTKLGSNELVAIGEIQQVGLYDTNSDTYISMNDGRDTNSPRKLY